MMKENPLRLFRKAKQWTRADMARRTGLGYQALDFIETGLSGKVTKRVMEKLLPFGVSPGLPEEYKVWKAVMQQYVEPELKEKNEGTSGSARESESVCAGKTQAQETVEPEVNKEAEEKAPSEPAGTEIGEEEPVFRLYPPFEVD